MTDIARERRQRSERRGPVASFHYPERRTGFERRRGRAGSYQRLMIWYRSRPRLVAMVVAGFLALNAADLLLTLRALELGATEANPVMAALFGIDPLLAGAFKLSIAGAVAAVMWALRRYRLILEAQLVLLAGFAALLAYHVSGGWLLAG